MLDTSQDGVVVPPIPQPRKNRRIIHGKMTVFDIVVAIPFVALAIAILFCFPLPIWASVLVFVGCAGLVLLLCWPMGFLGKEKMYIFILRAIRYWLISTKKMESEVIAGEEPMSEDEIKDKAKEVKN